MTHKIFRLVSSLFLALSMIVISSAPQPARAAGPWYVATTGDDNNDCLSPNSPCATINGAIGKASAGDSINVAGGTYNGSDTEVVLIDRDITLSGGWDASFTEQSGLSTIDGEAVRRGITVNSGVITRVDRFTMQNGSKNGGGGGIHNNGMLTLNNGIIADNVWGEGDGAGIFNSQTGAITLNNMVITRNGNQDLCNGTAISNEGIVTANNSTITENRVTDIFCGIGSAVINYTGPDFRGTIVLNNTTVSNNSPGGGIYNYGTLTLNNSTISNNEGDDSQGPGGIYNSIEGILTLNSSTITGNTTSGSGGGIFNIGFGGGTVTLQNSIVAGNTAFSTGPDCSGSIDSSGYNLIGDDFNCNFAAAAGDMTDIDPFLGSLQDNGGPTFTHALLPQSPAIDAGNIAGCMDQDGNLLTTDQRGIIRPQGIGCDIGAYEYTFTTPGPATSLAILSGSGQLSQPNMAFTKPLRVVALDNQGNRISGVTVIFTAPTSGPSGTFADTSLNTTSVDTDEGGVATASEFTANDQAGAYTVSASAAGLGSVNFNLEQVVRPANDNFANAKAITSLPFSDSLDNTQATTEPDEPQSCFSPFNTVWYSFTPAESRSIFIDMSGSAISGFVGLYRGDAPGIAGLVIQRCGSTASPIDAYRVEAGLTYFLQVGALDGEVGSIQINVQEIPSPSNDNFADAEAITSLPFSAVVDISGAGFESGEPQSCVNMEGTVWYSFSPAETKTVRVDTQGSLSGANLNVYHPFGPGISDQDFIACTVFSNSSSATFVAEAGQTYYLQAGAVGQGGGTIQINLQEQLPPAHDNFDHATVIPLPLPFDDTVDTSEASIEEGEPTPSCAFYGLGSHSVWYAFTPDRSRSISASIPSAAFTPVVAVYTANLVGDLTEVGCQNYGQPLTFRAKAGTTYYFQVSNLYPWEQGGSMQFHLEITPPPVADFYFYPTNPTFFDTIQFYDNSYDPAQAGIQSYLWNFGDGTRSTEPNPTHQYARDGNYTVRHTVTTVDGRKASISRVVQVKTHAVTIDIKPGQRVNRIILGSQVNPTVVVAILSKRNFNAPRQIDKNSLTFGHAGDEDSLNRTGPNLTPDCRARDVNGDDRPDLVCRFIIERTGFQLGDPVGILKGMTIRGIQIQGRDSVVIIIRSP